jgi:hypothetical protein
MARHLSLAGPSTTSVVMAAALLSQLARAHDHHEGESNIEEGETVSKDPIDSTLWAHIFVQMFAYGVVFPIGMVLGLSKNRWHVPTQIFGVCLAILGFFLGHLHGGRSFVGNNVHSSFAHVLQIALAAQVVLGLYLKGHWEKGINGKIRKLIRPCHSIIGKVMPVMSWVQIVFGAITALGFCQGEHVGQCAAHFIMGSAFIGYAIMLTILLLVGQMWLQRRGRSQEFYDSSVIALWGCINTFTEHRWGTAWVKNDWQHTTMGVIWWSAGLVGVWLSSDRDGNPKRNFIPGFIIFITGWAFTAHPQELMVSAMTHSMFGWTLMAAGVTRIIEIAFVLRDAPGVAKDGRSWNSFQYLPIFLLYAAGFMFMGATEEQMSLISHSDMDGVAYILVLFSLASVLFLFVHILVHIYDRNTSSDDKTKPYTNGHARDPNGRVRDAEEFELEGLTSDDEDDAREDGRMLRSSQDGVNTGTANKNHHDVAE